ncbi:MAG: TMEM165/GDT1 family protein, partial [Planctomycetes bacterium]|nr:TMEM165/GDT1 family protein [Planctomycetota bacterium]
MDWWKLFGGTFILIFLAELGDKTQLAAMAKTADSPDGYFAKWVVFAAASTALVLSTFIAVFLGHILKALVPDERYIRLAAGLLFLIFGAKILWEVYRAPEPKAAAAQHGSTSVAGQLAVAGAMEFETFAAKRYRSLARQAQDPHFRDVLITIAGEEDRHLAGLKNIRLDESPTASNRLWKDVQCPELAPSVGDAAIVAELVRHEKATAEFYHSLAQRTLRQAVV